MLPSVRSVYAEGEMENIVFVQDNSPIHTAEIVKEWLGTTTRSKSSSAQLVHRTLTLSKISRLVHQGLGG